MVKFPTTVTQQSRLPRRRFFLDCVSHERPATDRLNRRRNRPKTRPRPARFGRYFDFFAAKRTDPNRPFMVNFHLLAAFRPDTGIKLKPENKGFLTIARHAKG